MEITEYSYKVPSVANTQALAITTITASSAAINSASAVIKSTVDLRGGVLGQHGSPRQHQDHSKHRNARFRGAVPDRHLPRFGALLMGTSYPA